MIMQHGPHVARIDYDEDAGAFRGRVANLTRDGFDFYGRAVDQLRAAFARSAEEYEAFCLEQRIEPERPDPGWLLVRSPRARAQQSTDEADGAAYTNGLERDGSGDLVQGGMTHGKNHRTS